MLTLELQYRRPHGVGLCTLHIPQTALEMIDSRHIRIKGGEAYEALQDAIPKHADSEFGCPFTINEVTLNLDDSEAFWYVAVGVHYDPLEIDGTVIEPFDPDTFLIFEPHHITMSDQELYYITTWLLFGKGEEQQPDNLIHLNAE